MTGSIGNILDSAYRHELNPDVKERILLVRRVRVDRKNIVDVAKDELHRSRAWAYKWLKRFDTDDGSLGRLKDEPRSGRPPKVPEKKIQKIRKELSDNQSGWQAKEVMNVIYQKTGVLYHEVHIYRLLHEWGFSPKVPRMRFVNAAASNQEKGKFRKRLKG
jgi:transposase